MKKHLFTMAGMAGLAIALALTGAMADDECDTCKSKSVQDSYFCPPLTGCITIDYLVDKIKYCGPGWGSGCIDTVLPGVYYVRYIYKEGAICASAGTYKCTKGTDVKLAADWPQAQAYIDLGYSCEQQTQQWEYCELLRYEDVQGIPTC